MTTILDVVDMSTGYSGVPVVKEASFSVSEGEVVCLLGPNGAGKTTTMLALSGELPLQGGTVAMFGVPMTDPLYVRARLGLSYVTEERSVLKQMTAQDNLRVADVDVADVLSLFPELESRMSIRGGLLSGGEQQMLSLGRALARKPKLLLADELSLGLAPLIVDRLLKAVREAADTRGTGVLMVEQHARKALKYADKALVMRRGRIVLSLPAPEAIARIREIEESYLSSAVHDDSSEGDKA
ncbi:MAG: ATP-binding cassette domain-containing protein [Actinobacteria bacterium]|uniref:Unannotated protein n=1 Tax=freshwater metagenome TaxID=449393 RepID=A0A6J7QAW7_9ZZZZ|nr:ATP-binding cassette domain-containing protein [Actinomycetota bacterium]